MVGQPISLTRPGSQSCVPGHSSHSGARSASGDALRVATSCGHRGSGCFVRHHLMTAHGTGRTPESGPTIPFAGAYGPAVTTDDAALFRIPNALAAFGAGRPATWHEPLHTSGRAPLDACAIGIRSHAEQRSALVAFQRVIGTMKQWDTSFRAFTHQWYSLLNRDGGHTLPQANPLKYYSLANFPRVET